MRGIIPSGTVFLIIYVASLITMALITLKFIIGSPITIYLKYTPRFTASYIGLSAISDPKGWLYSKIEVGEKFNIRNYYGILDLFKIAYDIKYCPYNWSFCNSTCIKYCFKDYLESKEYMECINQCSDKNCEEECNNTGLDGCRSICNASCHNVYPNNRVGCSGKLLTIENHIIKYPIVEGNEISMKSWSVNFSKIFPAEYFGYSSYIDSMIPSFELLDPYIIEIKIYDLDYLRKKILEVSGYYNEEDSIVSNFTITTYCPYDKNLKKCTKGNILYELSFPVLLTNGGGYYWNGLFVVKVYDWKKT